MTNKSNSWYNDFAKFIPKPEKYNITKTDNISDIVMSQDKVISVGKCGGIINWYRTPTIIENNQREEIDSQLEQQGCIIIDHDRKMHTHFVEWYHTGVYPNKEENYDISVDRQVWHKANIIKNFPLRGCIKSIKNYCNNNDNKRWYDYSRRYNIYALVIVGKNKNDKKCGYMRISNDLESIYDSMIKNLGYDCIVSQIHYISFSVIVKVLRYNQYIEIKYKADQVIYKAHKNKEYWALKEKIYLTDI